jgi:hypothetical protein
MPILVCLFFVLNCYNLTIKIFFSEMVFATFSFCTKFWQFTAFSLQFSDDLVFLIGLGLLSLFQCYLKSRASS